MPVTPILAVTTGSVRFGEIVPSRSTHCHESGTDLDSESNQECVACGWLVCGCGACEPECSEGRT